MCGAEALLLALKLGSELVKPESIDTGIRTVNAVCICCLPTAGQSAMCEAQRLVDAEKRAEERNAKVKEYQAIAAKCGVEKKK